MNADDRDGLKSVIVKILPHYIQKTRTHANIYTYTRADTNMHALV